MSGVGRAQESPYPRYMVPTSYNARWNDVGCKFLERRRFHMQYKREAKGHDFIVHANCYSLLEQFFHPRPIPLARLVEACRSCPSQLTENYKYSLSWSSSSNYRGTFSWLIEYPWEKLDMRSRPSLYNGLHHPQEPWNIPELTRLLQASRLDASTQTNRNKSRPARRNKPRRAKTRLTVVKDIVSNYFTELPSEVLEYILAYVPTDSVKSLGRTSKGLKLIIPSGLGQSFWASRFQASFECGFVFEALTYEYRLDWKSLYFTLKSALFPELENRRRVWRIIQSLSGVLRLQWSGSHSLVPLDKTENELRRKAVHGDIRKSYIRHRQGCLQIYSQRTSIPTLLRRIVVSTFTIEQATYITGLRFICNQGSEICLGYKNGNQSTLETIGIQGFIVAVGSRGIHAIQFVSPTSHLSQWFGDPDRVPKTRRLATYRPIIAIDAGFDVRVTFFHLTCLLIKVY